MDNKTYAIAMWDFSWLERRWPGAGYENWDIALDELTERGYDAVRIDAYPHFIAVNPQKEWAILPCWNQQVWGSPARNWAYIQPSLNQFISKCKERDIQVGLSSWFQRDSTEARLQLFTPELFADAWVKTLQSIDSELYDTILYVDLCNEWPMNSWAPYFSQSDDANWATPQSIAWMKQSIDLLKAKFPNFKYTFSFASELDKLETTMLPFLDFLEPHLWMANSTNFYDIVGYKFNRWSSIDYENVVANAENVYRRNPQHWQKLLINKINALAESSQRQNKRLITTECWAIVDYKDWPGLSWDWVKELCAIGVKAAKATGQWDAIATSNFCGPQFVGMWRDLKWHQELTSFIKTN